MKKYIYLVLIFFWSLVGCSQGEVQKKKVEIVVSAAASLQDSLLQLKRDFEEENPHIQITFNFGSSGSLQQQISQGAPVDIFFSASLEKFKLLVKDGIITENQNLLSNNLVLIVPKNNSNDIKSIEEVVERTRRISIGTPETVPAGSYAKESLQNINVWEKLQDRLIYAKDVRQVLTYVETENVEAGIVYGSDALHSSKVHIVTSLPADTHSPIIYPVGVIESSAHYEEAILFYNFLLTDHATTVFEKFGFIR
jgi:molybdate transport system substrate-binding protein